MWVDVTTRPSGTIATVNGNGTVATLAGVVVPMAAGWLRMAATETVAACMGQSNNSYQVRFATDHGARLDLDEIAFGVQPCGLYQVGGDHFVASWVRNGNELRTVELSADLKRLTEIVTTPAFAGSQGLLDVNPPVYTDQQRIITEDGVQYGLSMFRWPYRVGQDYQGVFGGGVIAFDYRTRQHLLVWQGETQAPPRLAVRPDGSAVCAIMTSAGLFIESSVWTPAVRVPVSAPVPTLNFAEHHYTVVTFDEPNPRARFSSVWTPDWPADPHPDESNVVGMFYTVNQAGDWSDAVAKCRKYNYPLFAYWDSFHGYPLEMVPTAVGVKVVPIVQCYPMPGETAQDAISRIWAHVKALAEKYPEIGVAPAYYTLGHAVPLQVVLDVAAAVHEMVRFYQIRWVAPFSYTRGSGQDGIVAFPELQQLHQQLLAASAAPPIIVIPPAPPDIPDPIPEPDLNEDDMPIDLISNEQFTEQYVDPITEIVLPVEYPNPADHAHEREHVRASVTSAGDRIRGQGRNPTVLELLSMAVASREAQRRSQQRPPATAEQWDAMTAAGVALQERLRRP